MVGTMSYTTQQERASEPSTDLATSVRMFAGTVNLLRFHKTLFVFPIVCSYISSLLLADDGQDYVFIDRQLLSYSSFLNPTYTLIRC